MSTPEGCCHTASHEGQTCEQYDITLAGWAAANRDDQEPLRPAGIVYNPSNISPLDAERLAWAKRKATEPFEWCHDRVRCAFCGQQQALMWNGAMETFHSDTCLAVRANKP